MIRLSTVTCPLNDNLQLLEPGGPEGTLMAAYGPGDTEYQGGRWKLDTNDDGEIERYFSCPLLDPGRENP